MREDRDGQHRGQRDRKGTDPEERSGPDRREPGTPAEDTWLQTRGVSVERHARRGHAISRASTDGLLRGAVVVLVGHVSIRGWRVRPDVDTPQAQGMQALDRPPPVSCPVIGDRPPERSDASCGCTPQRGHPSPVPKRPDSLKCAGTGTDGRQLVSCHLPSLFVGRGRDDPWFTQISSALTGDRRGLADELLGFLPPWNVRVLRNRPPTSRTLT